MPTIATENLTSNPTAITNAILASRQIVKLLQSIKLVYKEAPTFNWQLDLKLETSSKTISKQIIRNTCHLRALSRVDNRLTLTITMPSLKITTLENANEFQRHTCLADRGLRFPSPSMPNAYFRTAPFQYSTSKSMATIGFLEYHGKMIKNYRGSQRNSATGVLACLGMFSHFLKGKPIFQFQENGLAIDCSFFGVGKLSATNYRRQTIGESIRM